MTIQCDYLDKIKDDALMFGDYEKDEITGAIEQYADFRDKKRTRYYRGRSVERLKDTIYFTQSHHSRFLQAADMLLYMAQRYEGGPEPEKHHDLQLKVIWEKFKASADYQIQCWP